MCILTGSVSDIRKTRIFCGRTDNGHHLVYQMTFRPTHPVAMILPVPTMNHTEEKAVSFIDLSHYPDFFDDLDKAFPWTRQLQMGRTISRATLEVHSVGDYIASYVPGKAAFDRLDTVFQLPDSAWNSIPDYTGYGFAVFQFQAWADPIRVHPIAYHYTPVAWKNLFYPTTHLHNGGFAHRYAYYDHVLYTQTDECVTEDKFKEPDMLVGQVPTWMRREMTKGIIGHASKPVSVEIKGEGRNGDHIWDISGDSFIALSPTN
jgi:hypothetical protein